MKKLWTVLFLFLACNLSSWGQSPANSQPASLAYILDPGQKSVTSIDLSNGKTKATVSVEGSQDAGLDRMEMTPDGSQLVVLTNGIQEKDALHAPALKSKSTVTIVDAKTMTKLFQPIDAGWNLSNYFITPDSKILVTISSGFNSPQPKNSLPGEIVTTNLSSGQVIDRIPISRQITTSLISKDGKTAILYFARRKLPYGHYSQAELQFISIEKKVEAGTIKQDGDLGTPFFSPTGEYIYILDRGKPSHNPRKNINGKILVISLKYAGIAATLDAGSNPRIALPDDGTGQTLILSDGPPVPMSNEIVDAELRVLRSTSIEGVLKVGNGPKYLSFSPDRKRLYVTSTFDYNSYEGLSADGNAGADSSENKAAIYSGFDLLTAIDYAALKVLGRIPLDGVVSGVIITPDGSHGFTLDPKSSKMLTLDLQAMKPGAVISTGRNGVKAEHFILSSVEGSASLVFPLASIAFSPMNSVLYSAANTLMSVRPDGAFVYVLNHETHDVTAVNTKDSSIAAKIAAGGGRLQLLEGGGVLAVIGNNSISRIDTATQKALPEIHFKNELTHLFFSPDGRTIAALTKGAVTLLDGKSGEIQNQMDGFTEPRMVLFAPPK
jgi:DNA-binding beta-propeller fold protein YncE